MKRPPTPGRLGEENSKSQTYNDIWPSLLSEKDQSRCHQNGDIGNNIIARTYPHRTHIDIIVFVMSKKIKAEKVTEFKRDEDGTIKNISTECTR